MLRNIYFIREIKGVRKYLTPKMKTCTGVCHDDTVYLPGLESLRAVMCTQSEHTQSVPLYFTVTKKIVVLHRIMFVKIKGFQTSYIYMSRLVGNPTMWFPNRSHTNRPVQAQKLARSLKFRI